MIYLLRDDEISFPDPRDGEPNGLFAVGGDLSVPRLLLAYSHGIFPWYAFRKEDAYLDLCKEDGEPYIQWWCPMQRFVIFPDEIHISHSMKQMMKKEEYNVTFCQDFKGVITNCGALREKEKGAWLGEHIIEAYTRLFDAGYAASVEVWKTEDDAESPRLVGGLYGVCIGKCFIGESMFSLVPSASKLALIVLAKYMQQHGGLFIDCQLETPHLKSMGGRFISYDQYMSILQEGLAN